MLAGATQELRDSGPAARPSHVLSWPLTTPHSLGKPLGLKQCGEMIIVQQEGNDVLASAFIQNRSTSPSTISDFKNDNDNTEVLGSPFKNEATNPTFVSK